MTYDMDKAYSTHAISRSLIPLLSLPPLEGFHLSVSAEPTPTVLLPELGIPSHSVGVCIVVGWLEGRMLLVRNPLHRARSCARVWWKLLGIGSSWSPRHPTYHRACHRGFHLGCCLASREGSLQVHRQEHSQLEGYHLHSTVPFVRLSLQRCILQGVGGLNGLRADGLVEGRIHSCRFVKLEQRCKSRIENVFRVG